MAKRGRPKKAIAQIVWLGDPEQPDLLKTEWNEVTFLRGVPTNVSDPYFVQKASGSRYFEVIDG